MVIPQVELKVHGRRGYRLRWLLCALWLGLYLAPTLARAYPFAVVTQTLLANGNGIYNSRSPLNCTGLAGGTWVPVPGSSVYGNDSFCVMKYGR